MQNFDRCKGCNAWIQWALSPNRKNIPLDGEAITSSQDDRAIRHRKTPLYTLAEGVLTSQGNADVAFSAARGQPLYISHYATCPNAAQFSRRGR